MQDKEDKKFGFKDYAITLGIGLLSLPLAGYYLVRKGKGGLAPNMAIAAITSFLIPLGLNLWQTRDVQIYKTENVRISYNHELFPANQENVNYSVPNAFFMLIRLFGTNYHTYDQLFNPPKNKVTHIAVSGTDGSDEFRCFHEINGFIMPGSIDYNVLQEPDIELNRQRVNGGKGKGFYNDLCGEIFEDDKEFFPFVNLFF